jgi:hypothetical protein
MNESKQAMLERLVTSLREAFQRKRYGASADYDPDFDLFDAAADAIEDQLDMMVGVADSLETIVGRAGVAPALVAAIIERCAKIADPWPGYWIDHSSTEADCAVVAVRTKIAAQIRGDRILAALTRPQPDGAVAGTMCSCKASQRDGQHMAWCPAVAGTERKRQGCKTLPDGACLFPDCDCIAQPPTDLARVTELRVFEYGGFRAIVDGVGGWGETQLAAIENATENAKKLSASPERGGIE